MTDSLTALTDRFHPARGGAGVPPLLRNGRAFAQATPATRSSAGTWTASPNAYYFFFGLMQASGWR